MSYVIVGTVCTFLGAGLLVLGIWLHVRKDESTERCGGMTATGACIQPYGHDGGCW